ncbi:hypothetical protein HYPSUDRAFT_347469 [Hypholoma sublateritium FD-334 SS-4]|uniref:ACB domain-containing protein n=1 Tax=Hypholoma sublateritium (strain FD-334 SS-4) TaxID=945553 RepID=A0A0D2Q3B6_HYPSF|nr:hypothetical protein HYPSUDRAFT_347469 [Hypholoma sublateritium FD-334 SS-4]
MSNIQPSPAFQNAASYLSSAPSLAQVSSAVKLELYGLFKYVTSSRTPATSRPSIFDMTARAKWDAWAATGKKYEAVTEAEQRYLDLAQSLGWAETIVNEPKQKLESELVDYDTLLDSPYVASAEGSSRGGGDGLGPFVSSMAPQEVVHDASIHGLVLSNDASGLETLLTIHPETDLNALDEFGYAPIHLACDRGNVEVVKILLERGVDLAIKDPDDLTPLELSQEAGHNEIEKLLVATP